VAAQLAASQERLSSMKLVRRAEISKGYPHLKSVGVVTGLFAGKYWSHDFCEIQIPSEVT
jgi:hypothetical protein